MQKKYAKICVYQKKGVILHRGFVRALGAYAQNARICLGLELLNT
jgi:hypothetical protein